MTREDFRNVEDKLNRLRSAWDDDQLAKGGTLTVGGISVTVPDAQKTSAVSALSSALSAFQSAANALKV